MKRRLSEAIGTARFTFMLALLFAAAFWVTGCSTTASDPLAGWKIDYLHKPDRAIETDYQDYVSKLPPKERYSAGIGHYYEDGTGQHAVVVEVTLNGRWWNHVLIYDGRGERIKVIEYLAGRYRS